jgi:predicted restriction endonuclease
LEKIKLEIQRVHEICPQYSPNDYQFLIEIAELVVAARRSLSFTYPIRFYLKGQNKQQFFDFIQSDLERSLEMLNKKNEEEWVGYLETNGLGMIQLTDKFFAYKQNIVTLRETLNRHFNTCMTSIKNGLPEVEDEELDDFEHAFDASMVGKWTCRVCQVRNQEKDLACTICHSKRTKLEAKDINARVETKKPAKKEEAKKTGLLQKVKSVFSNK